jgi:hypothetical protein
MNLRRIAAAAGQRGGRTDRARPATRHRVSACVRNALPAFALLALLVAPPAIALDRDAYRGDLVGLIRMVGEIQARLGQHAPGSRAQLERAAQLYATLDDDQVDALAASLPESQLRAIVSQSRRLLQASPVSRGKDAVAVTPDVSPSFCNDYPAPVALAALATKLTTRFVIESLEFTCNESVPPGVNAALACEAPEIAAATAEIASKFADFCGGQQSAATNQAVLDTERSIGRHLEARLDVELSTRATQLSVDAANTAASSADAKVAEIRTQLDQDYAQIALQIADAIDDLSDLAGDVSEIQSRTDDIAFRVQAVQADVEDVQDRSADLQARAGELQDSLSASLALAALADAGAATLAAPIESAARQQRRDDLAAALGDADARISGFALPASAGGSLEEAREVLIEAILALQSLGQGDTAQALSLLAAGDQHYNAARYLDAWRQFGAAYRALDPHVAAARSATR